jgi:hypothetical protein
VKLHDNHTSGEHYEEVKIEDTKEHAAQSKTSASFSKVDNIRVISPSLSHAKQTVLMYSSMIRFENCFSYFVLSF